MSDEEEYIPILYVGNGLSFKPNAGYGMIYRYNFHNFVHTKADRDIYIGQTRTSMKYRDFDHNRHKSHTPADYIIKTHEYHIDILWMGDVKSLDAMEKFFILRNNSLFPGGWNMTSGGKDCITSDIFKKKMKVVYDNIPHIPYHHTEEYKKMASEMMKGKYAGEKHPMYGKHHTDASREKMRLASHKYFKTHDGHNKGKAMPQEQKDKISKACKGKGVGSENKFYGKQHSYENKHKMSNAKLKKYCDGQFEHYFVAMYDLCGKFIRGYNTITDASTDVGVSCSCISDCFKGRQRTAGRHIWKIQGYNGEMKVW